MESLHQLLNGFINSLTLVNLLACFIGALKFVAGKAKVVSIPHAGGSVHEPEAILKQIIEAAS